MVLMRTDPFRELDRLSQQVFGTAARPAFMPMDAWREGNTFFVEFDLPGVDANSIDLDVERNVLTVRADRPMREGASELVAAERP
jgi:HSP20 family protein